MTHTDEKCSQISWEIQTRSTWQSLLCFALLCWCWRHAACIPLGADLRAQDTRSQVTSHSVVASCRRIQPFRVFGFFELFQLGKVQNFPASFSSPELSAHQMTPAGVIPHSSPPAGIIRHSCPRASEVYFFFHFFEVSVRLLGLVLPRGWLPFLFLHVRGQGKSELAGQRAHWTRGHSGTSLFGVVGAE